MLIGILPYPLRRDLRTNFYRYYFSAIYNIKNGNLDEAEEIANLTKNIIREKKEAFLSFYLLGCIKAAKSDWSAAKYYLENALDVADNRKDSIVIEPWLLYVYYYDDGLYSTYEEAKKFNSGIPEERVYRALFLVDEERYKDALNILKGLNNHEADYIRSYIYYKTGQIDSALYWLSVLDSLNDVEKVFYSTLLYEKGEYEKSYSLIKTVPKSDVYSVVLQALIESKLKSENLFQTYKKYRDLLRGKPEFGKIALITAQMYFERKDYGKVVSILEDVMTQLNEDERKKAMFYLGTSYVFLKRYANALKVWEKLVNEDREHYDYTHFQMGRCAYELELDSIAMENLLRLHDTSAYYFWGLYLTARVLLRLKSENHAMKLLGYITSYPVERSLKRRVYYNLAKLLLRRGEWDSAGTYFNRLVHLGFEGWDIDSAQYLYEYCLLQTGKYRNPVELNLAFTRKYPKNHLVTSLLDEVFTYFMTENKIDSAFSMLFMLRHVAPDSIYIDRFKKFVENLDDTLLLNRLIDSVKNSGYDAERLILAKKLIELSDGARAIDVLEGVSNEHRRNALLLFARAYETMGRSQEEELVLKEAFPPFDSTGSAAFMKLSSLKLKTEGMDSFYSVVFTNRVPDSLKIIVLKEASEDLLDGGDTLNALEIRSRLKELEGSDDSMEGN